MVKFLLHKTTFLGGGGTGLTVKSFFFFFTAKTAGFAKNYFTVSTTLAADNLFQAC